MKTRAISLLLLLSLAASVFYACKKDQNTTDQHAAYDETVYTPKAAKLVQDITRFKQKMTHVRENPQLKSGEVINKENARWNLETLFNATYGFPDLTYRKTVTDTALLYLPVDASGNAMLEDVVAVYDEILSRVTGFYINSNFDEKGFLFMQLSNGDVVNGQMEIKLSVVTGARSSVPNDPPVALEKFTEEDNYMYGDRHGKCDFTSHGTDAAQQLEFAIIGGMNGVWPEPPPSGFRWITVNPFEIILKGNEFRNENDEYLIFYLEKPYDTAFTHDEMCLSYSEMNFHYIGEHQVIYSLVPQTYNHFNDLVRWSFLNCVITGKNVHVPDAEVHSLIHENTLKYAERILVPIHEIELPIELSSQ